jgi:predicted transposase/invertase (TIGR01784 family)
MDDKKIITPAILPPSDDGVFKTLLTHPDAENVLKSVIASFSGIPVRKAEVRNNDMPLLDSMEKQERFDVNCVVDRNENGEGGEQVEVEMQANAMVDDSFETGHKNIKSRSILNLCDLHAKQRGRGIVYGSFMRSFQITLCDYTVFPESKDFLHQYRMRKATGEELSDMITIIFVELTKLGEIIKKPVKEMTSAEMWAVFFEYADKPKQDAVIKAIASEKEEIMEATNILTSISQDENECAKFRARRKFQQDVEHNRLASFKLGKEEGRKEEKYAIARALLKKMPVEDIAGLTGLTPDEVSAISGH